MLQQAVVSPNVVVAAVASPNVVVAVVFPFAFHGGTVIDVAAAFHDGTVVAVAVVPIHYMFFELLGSPLFGDSSSTGLPRKRSPLERELHQPNVTAFLVPFQEATNVARMWKGPNLAIINYKIHFLDVSTLKSGIIIH